MESNAVQMMDKNSCPIDTPVLAYAEIAWERGTGEEYTKEFVICERLPDTKLDFNVIHDRAGFAISCKVIGWIQLPSVS